MRISDILYRYIVRPVLFRFNPDFIHEAIIDFGEFLGRFAFTRGLVALFYDYRGPDISKTLDGIRYERPVLLSAGFDSNGRLTRLLKSVSFGGEEIGSTTAEPCEGNPPPRQTRLIRNYSIIVNKGLRNQGVEALIERLKRTPRTPDYVIGISIARTNSKASCIDVEAGIVDFVYSYKRLNEENIGDYYTINISCPNTFDGDSFADPALLGRLLAAYKAIPSKKPLYLKMPISYGEGRDFTWEEFKKLCEIADAYGVHGLIIGNLSKNYRALDFPEDVVKKNIATQPGLYSGKSAPTFRGGLSGKPCFTLSTELLRKTREAYGRRFTLIGVGGILSTEDAMAKFDAGADLVMLVSGMIFSTPGIVRNICYAYAKRLRP